MKLINYTLHAAAFLCMFTAQAAGQGTIIEVKDEAHYKNILAEKKSVVIDFYATWCGVCKRAEPDVQKLAEQFTDITFIKLDGDKFENLKKQYTVVGYPTFIFLDETGKETDRVVGRKMEAIKKSLEKIHRTKTAAPAPAAKKPKMEEAKPVTAKKIECTDRCPMPTKKVEETTKTNHIELASAADFDALLKAKKPMVLDFYTTWCGPCKMMKPVIESLSKDYPAVNFVKIDAERYPTVAKRYTITGYPTFVFINAQGKQVDSFSGATTSKIMMTSKIDKIAK